MQNFWQNLPKPILVLAPMEGVTDCSFREMFAKCSSPIYGPSEADKSANYSYHNDFVMFTEFVNVDGLLHPEGFERLKVDLMYTENQRPIVAQIWGREPEKFNRAASILAKMGFDGLDINFGCPQDKEISQKTCAALIREPELAGQIIDATIKGAGGLPVSVKTRMGYSKADEMEGWLINLLKYPLAAVSIHARTKQEKSKVPAHWDKIVEAVQIRNKRQENREKDKTLIIGNGDIKTREEALERIAQTGCDGVMVGRGAFGNPWFFAHPYQNLNAGTRRSPPEADEGRYDNHQPSITEKLSVMLEHAQLFNQLLAKYKSFLLMRKNFKAYCSGFEGAHELRAKLMETKNVEEVRKIVNDFVPELVEGQKIGQNFVV